MQSNKLKMDSGGTNRLIKMLMVVLNGLFIIMGIIILGVAIYVSTDSKLAKFNDLLAGVNTLRNLRFFLIVTGVLIPVMGLCGCFGACKENRFLLVLYVLFVFLILILNLAAVVLSVVYHNNVKSLVIEQVKDKLKLYYSNSTDLESRIFTELINKFQKMELCCGWTGPGSKENVFASTPWNKQQSGTNRTQFPESCCAPGVLEDPRRKEQCLRPTNEEESRNRGIINKQDCMEKLIDLNGNYMRAVLGTVILAILLQIMCLACGLIIIRLNSADS